jgi:hypothetical protein
MSIAEDITELVENEERNRKDLATLQKNHQTLQQEKELIERQLQLYKYMSNSNTVSLKAVGRIREIVEDMSDALQLRAGWVWAGDDATLFVPRPIDLSAVNLPKNCVPLAERVAVASHRQWMDDRGAMGWSLGDAYDEEMKSHPKMVAYESLPDDTKAELAAAAVQTLKLVIAAGCTIIPHLGAVSGDVMKEVPTDLGVLIDVMAYNTHEAWCEKKISDGYMYGADRDEHNKTHPQILPYYMVMQDCEGMSVDFNRKSAAASIMCVFNSGGQIKVARDRQNSICATTTTTNLSSSMGAPVAPGRRTKDDINLSRSMPADVGAPAPATLPTKRRSLSPNADARR